jgi:hypothetical protein
MKIHRSKTCKIFIAFVIVLSMASIVKTAYRYNKTIIKIVPDKDTSYLAANALIKLPGSDMQKFPLALFHSQFSSYAPGLEGNKEGYYPWAWDDSGKFLVFSVLENPRVYKVYSESRKKIYGEEYEDIFGYEKQVIYLLDKDLKQLTVLLELKWEDINCLMQQLRGGRDTMLFCANKCYLIDLKKKTASLAQPDVKR